ncbi:MAG: hypothetical protein Q7R92_02620 [bacterium]|nr:hypothetical protein [bacterium]
MLFEIKKILSLRIYELGGILFDVNGFKFNLHAEHPEAPLSPNYVDLRGIFRNCGMRKMIAGLMMPQVMEMRPDRLVDLPESATPLIATLSDMTGIEMISLRSEALKGEAKSHGAKKIINGDFTEGQTCLLIDDVVSSFAFTKFKAIPILRSLGLKLLPTVCVVIDREEGGKEKLAKEGFELKSLLGLHSDITEYCINASLIPEKIHRMSVKFAKAAKKYSLES